MPTRRGGALSGSFIENSARCVLCPSLCSFPDAKVSETCDQPSRIGALLVSLLRRYSRFLLAVPLPGPRSDT